MTYTYEEKQSINYRVRAPMKDSELSMVFYGIIAIVVLCIYLSWTYNTKKGKDFITKVINAFFAAMFNILYLIYYVLFNRS